MINLNEPIARMETFRAAAFAEQARNVAASMDDISWRAVRCAMDARHAADKATAQAAEIQQRFDEQEDARHAADKATQ